MISIAVPGEDPINIHHLVLDVNGTLAVDGTLISGVEHRLQRLKTRVSLHLLTADTHGKQADIDQTLGLTAVRVTGRREAERKGRVVDQLGPEHTAAVGQGANDRMMLENARIGICLMSPEGTAVETLQSADLVVGDICTALDLLLHPRRITASLRT